MPEQTLSVTNDDEIQDLKVRFVDLYEQICHMRDSEFTVLNSLYIQHFGQTKINIMILEGEVKALKLKTETMQAAINRDEKPDVELIEKSIAKKFEEYFKRINEEARKQKEAENLTLMDENDAKKLTDLHRALVKKLHPDLNPQQTEEEKELFLKVQSAYDLKDLTALERIMINLELGQYTSNDMFTSAKELADYRQKLKDQVTSLEKQIALINSKYPFTFREKLFNEEWVANEKARLKAAEDHLRSQKNELERRYQLQKEYFGFK